MIVKSREPLSSREILWGIVAVTGTVIFVAAVVLIINGEPSGWLTGVSALLTTSLAIGSLSAGRRDRHQRVSTPEPEQRE